MGKVGSLFDLVIPGFGSPPPTCRDHEAHLLRGCEQRFYRAVRSADEQYRGKDILAWRAS
jgi:hypothetical protein